MKKEDIKEETLELKHEGRSCKLMLEGAISGAAVYHHVLLPGDEVKFIADGSYIRVLFVCSGTLDFIVDGVSYSYIEKAFLATAPEQDVELNVGTKVNMLEIRWSVFAEDMKEMKKQQTIFPITGKYLDAEQYRDPFKSEKTISRAILPQRVIPRFAMGSVETYGEDLIGQHAHPLLDQFFFGFPENDMELLIDDLSYPMKGDSLLHIPLGSNHGVKVGANQTAHYIWIDFIQNPEAANAYLDEVHKPTGTIRSFEAE